MPPKSKKQPQPKYGKTFGKDLSPSELAATLVKACVAEKVENPFAEWVFSNDDLDRILAVIVEVAKLLIKTDFASEEEKQESNIATENHTLAALIMLVIGAMLERGAPCVEQVIPIFFARLKVAMDEALKNKTADAVKSLTKMYLPIVAGFSMSPVVRRKGTSQEIRDMIDRCIETEVGEDLQWIRRMLNIKEDEEILCIDVESKVGCVCRLSGISDVAQLQCLLNLFFPRSKDDVLAVGDQRDNQKFHFRHIFNYTWNCWSGLAGDNLDKESLDLVTVPSVLRAMISQEASIDEIPVVPFVSSTSTLTTENEDDDAKKQEEDSPLSYRVLLLAPPIYMRSLDVKGVFHNMNPDVEIVKRLTDEEVTNWLKSCIEYAKQNPMSDEEKKNEREPRPYPKREHKPAAPSDLVYGEDDSSDSEASFDTDNDGDEEVEEDE